MKPGAWGPIFWKFLHVVAENYDQIEDKSFVNFVFKNFHRLLPCKTCKDSFFSICSRYPIAQKFNMNTRDEAIQQVCRLHNAVNKKLKRKIYDIPSTHERLISKISKTSSNEEDSWSDHKWKWFLVLGLFFVLGVLAGKLFK